MNRTSIGLLLVALFLAPLTQAGEKLALPHIVGHRGLIHHAPENTLAGFAACLELRLGFELDVRRSKDGQLVCVHDETVDRTSNGKGKVGIATGKANEVSEAVRKAVDAAKRSMVELPRIGATIPHEVVGTHGAGRVLLKPAASGTGVIAGGPVRAVLECAGITDILTKSLGSNNPHNMVRATMQGLASLVTVRQIARERGIEADSIPYRAPQEVNRG